MYKTRFGSFGLAHEILDLAHDFLGLFDLAHDFLDLANEFH